jgi:hypothetical protein
MRLRKLSILLGAAAVSVGVLGALPAFAADHRDSPLTKAAPRSDINDVYVFKGEQAATLVMTVNPLTSPADTAGLRLDPDTLYEFKIDTNGDATADLAYKLTVDGTGSVQDVTVRRASGADAVTNAISGDVVLQGKTSSGSAVNVVSGSNGSKLFVGPRDDPFFFDLAGFQAGLKFTGTDTFKGTNITAIVLDLPQAPAQQFGVWATTSKKDNLGNWVQLDRMGRPAINTVFIPADQKDAFNNNTPDRDKGIYTDEVKAALNSLNSPATDGLAGILLPDILTVDMSKPVGYLNGRGLSDDVIDISLQAITGSTTIGDGVNANDRAFSAQFPYLASPNTGGAAPEAPNTGNTIANTSSSDYSWTLPAGLIAAGVLMGAAGYVQTRRKASVQA